MVGTGDGAFAINVYGIDLDEPIGDRSRMTGTASLGSRLATSFTLDAEANVDIFPSGDYNRDGAVDAADYIVWRKSEGQTGAGLAADGDGSDAIDEADYMVWHANFGRTSESGTAAAGSAGGLNPAVPEPGTLFLGCSGASIGLLWRRNRFQRAC
jgi:hypothetical protein